jgi:hypothetical protein
MLKIKHLIKHKTHVKNKTFDKHKTHVKNKTFDKTQNTCKKLCVSSILRCLRFLRESARSEKR